jgi:hypothetical protein
VLNALRAGNPIEAMKLLRKAKGFDLKGAKDAIDAHLRSQASELAARAAGAAGAHRGIDTLHQKAAGPRSRLSPGEVSRSAATGNGWFVALAAGVAAVYYFLR